MIYHVLMFKLTGYYLIMRINYTIKYLSSTATTFFWLQIGKQFIILGKVLPVNNVSRNSMKEEVIIARDFEISGFH